MEDIPPLRAVDLLFRSKTEFADLSHVVTSVSVFLDTSVELPLHKACSHGSLKLVERLWAASKIYRRRNLNVDNSWSLRRFLKRDGCYRRYQFNLSLVEAVKCKNLEMVKWLAAKFQGNDVEKQVVTEAARVGAMEILQFLLENDSTALQKRVRNINPGNLKRISTGLHVIWPGEALEIAVENGHNRVMWWFLHHMPNLRYNKSKALDHAVSNGDIALAEWLLSNGASWPRETRGRRVVHDIAVQGRLDVLKWLADKGQVQGTAGMVLIAAENGHLQVVRWLLDLDAGDYYQSKLTGLGAETSLAIHIAAVNGHLEIAKYLRARAQTPQNALQRTAETVEQKVQIRQLKQLGEPTTAIVVSANTLVEAGRNGHSDVVRWLYLEYYGDRKFGMIGSGSESQQIPTETAVMDAAAVHGHLKVLVLIQALAIASAVSTRKRLRDGTNKDENRQCTAAAMDGAASNGHLEVVKWLHESRAEGCTKHAMDGAATGGHLEVLKWLHQHRLEGCSTTAMDGAARNGHLDVIKWLHTNTTAGCTTKAMDDAATYGYLDVVKWLHSNLDEGCTVAAMDGAASNGYWNVVKWLHRNRTEGCTTSAMDNAARHGHILIVQWLHSRGLKGTNAAINSAAAEGNFEMFLFLHSQCQIECTRETMLSTSPSQAPEIHTWISKNYPAILTLDQE